MMGHISIYVGLTQFYQKNDTLLLLFYKHLSQKMVKKTQGLWHVRAEERVSIVLELGSHKNDIWLDKMWSKNESEVMEDLSVAQPMSLCLCSVSTRSKNNLWPWHHVTEHHLPLIPKHGSEEINWPWVHDHDHERQTVTLLGWKDMCLPCHSWLTVLLQESKAAQFFTQERESTCWQCSRHTPVLLSKHTHTQGLSHTLSFLSTQLPHMFCLWDWSWRRRQDMAHRTVCLFKIGRRWAFPARLRVSVKNTEHSCLTANTGQFWLRLS